MMLLEIQNLRLHYSSGSERVKAVNNMSFELNTGEALGIVGESGSGKTSLSLAIMRMLPKNTIEYSGTIKMDGNNLLDLSNEEYRKTIRWKTISMVFQGAMNSLNPVIRVGKQIGEPLMDNPKELSMRQDIILKMLDMVKLPHEVSLRYPHELSGGMKQRVMIAMALILEPKLVILDEPTSSLDVSIQAQIMNIFKDLKWRLGMSFIFITHDIALASDLSDKIAVMYAGEIVEFGNAEDILLRPQHPYTQMLLDSIPNLYSDEKPKFISGETPDMTHLPSGCSFHPRCPMALDECRVEKPPYFQIYRHHKSLCWLHKNND